jgi:ribA/ribD-fused uncharacterized protein
MVKSIDRFDGQYRFLSNFWLCRLTVISCFPDNHTSYIAPSIEHAFQALKATSIQDFQKILLMETPSQAKWEGRKIPIRKDWEDVKLDVMESLLRVKFADLELKQLLLATGTAKLIEGNFWGDTYWGVCAGIGRNNLGKLLMKIRDELRES